MLATYYDVATSQSEFDALFGGLDIHQNVTALARSFRVLRFDLTFDVDSRSSFADCVNSSVMEFLAKYNLNSTIYPENPCLSFVSAMNAAKNDKVFVVVDHLDRFIHELVDRRMYKPTLALAPSVRGSSSICSLLEAYGQVRGGHRLFAAGTLPLEFREDFTFSNVTNDRAPLAGALGFRKRDLSRGLDLIPCLSAEQRRGALDLMCRHLNGYMFRGGEEAVYNPAQSLFLLDHLTTGLRDIDELLALDVAQCDRTLREKVLDPSVVPNSGFIELICSVSNGRPKIAALLHGCTPFWTHIDRRVSADELLHSLTHDQCVQSLLYHLGLVTYDASGETLRVPRMARHVLIDAVMGDKLNQSQTSN
jgi:hypothetical protein